jgi:hypothetical protein
MNSLTVLSVCCPPSEVLQDTDFHGLLRLGAGTGQIEAGQGNNARGA